MKVPEKTLRADARRNREQIISSAQVLFARDGERAQMEQIADHAGVGIGTVYRHFPTKADLLTEMVRSRFTRFAEIATEAELIEDPYESLEFLISGSAHTVENDAGFQLAMMGSDELDWEGIEEDKAAFDIPATRIINRAVDAGAVRSDFSFDDFPMLMCGITSTMYFSPAGAKWQRHLELVMSSLRP